MVVYTPREEARDTSLEYRPLILPEPPFRVLIPTYWPAGAVEDWIYTVDPGSDRPNLLPVIEHRAEIPGIRRRIAGIIGHEPEPLDWHEFRSTEVLILCGELQALPLGNRDNPAVRLFFDYLTRIVSRETNGPAPSWSLVG